MWLYFSPRQFPNLAELQYGDINESFYSLKNYVIEQSKKEGEVSCRGGDKPRKSVRFSCKTKNCKFNFILKWEKYGYFIHYHNAHLDEFVGCMTYNHK